MRARIAVLLLTAVLAACSTRQIVPTEPIPVPSGLTVADVEAVLMRAMQGARPHSYFMVPARWRAEQTAPGHMTIGLHLHGGHYLRLGVNYDKYQVQTEILSSQNLKQSGDRIHRHALRWQADLERWIAQELAYAASQKQQPRSS